MTKNVTAYLLTERGCSVRGLILLLTISLTLPVHSKNGDVLPSSRAPQSLLQRCVAHLTKPWNEKALRIAMRARFASMGYSTEYIEEHIERGFSDKILFGARLEPEFFERLAKGERVEWPHEHGSRKNSRILHHLPWISLHTENLDWLPVIIREFNAPGPLWELMLWSPIWETSVHRGKIFESLLRILERPSSHYLVRLHALMFRDLFDLATVGEREMVQKSALAFIEASLAQMSDPIVFADSALPLLMLLPYKDLPQQFRTVLQQGWIDFAINRPLDPGSVDSFVHDLHFAGNCQNMFYGHCLGLDPQTVATPEGSLVVRVQGLTVGLLKRSGNASMLAVRNIVDKEGRLILVAGGVYALPERLIENKLTGERTNRILLKNLRFIDVERLKVYPGSFLLNLPDQDRMLGNYFGSEIPEFVRSPRTDFWTTVLKRLDQIAVQFDSTPRERVERGAF